MLRAFGSMSIDFIYILRFFRPEEDEKFESFYFSSNFNRSVHLNGLLMGHKKNAILFRKRV